MTGAGSTDPVRRRRGRARPSPLPIRDGVDATRVVLRSGPELTVGQALLAAPVLAGLTADDLGRRAAAGEIVDADGRPADLAAPSSRNVSLYLYRDLDDEIAVPFDLPVIHHDENIVVVDKPHFLATMPRGRHVTETALVRLRRELGSDTVSPAHRLDRLTAGVLLFTLRPEVRAAYQDLFASRTARKEYLALAPADEALASTVTVRDRIEKTAGDLRALVVDGPVNAISDITLTEVVGGLGVYRLVPHTGRTHQLRLHMASLGVPIVDDPLYPDVRPGLAALPDHGDFTRPLRLVARSLEFTDPLTGEERRFESRRPVSG
ncbi:pseudouridine synthase [Gordonia sp. BP-94]|nr:MULTISPECIES: pseudouridine synthase [unclassified Gordonia (in: high G+C Gram-positive bacteria)]MBN0971197.1 pseudouridine synthase [Gordonia sp. BP-119]MBN0981817.1 pseudouridine synthase [Gordonia sp. BP-94]MCX2754131.1 pseudouridine synthase [Gordonia sp. 4N]